MKVAKAVWHNGRGNLGEYVTIGKFAYSPKTIMVMWNEVPDEIRKQIQSKRESDL